jgi:hypothetical protein
MCHLRIPVVGKSVALITMDHMTDAHKKGIEMFFGDGNGGSRQAGDSASALTPSASTFPPYRGTDFDPDNTRSVTELASAWPRCGSGAST